MLLCSLDNVQPGTELAAAVFHPRRPGVELLRPGVVLDHALLVRLRQLGVGTIWVACDATADLDALMPEDIGQTRRAAYELLKQNFSAISRSTVTAGDVQRYRQIIMDLVLELMGNRHLAGLSEQLFAGPPSLFTHGANVAYLSVLVGLRLEAYVIQQRDRLEYDHARDLTNLGIGAMLHDIGKLGMAKAVARRTAIDPGDPSEPKDAEAEQDGPDYHEHPQLGYEMLSDTQTPATAKQIALNHHQRWDGKGYPDLSAVTRQRRRGPQQGEQIHVFCRIVAVADVMDHLIREAQQMNRPTVAALRAMHEARFDGWFDPIVRDMMLRCLPPFPVGSHLRLSSGQEAVAIAPSLDQPCRPVVRLLDDAAGEGQAGSAINLQERLGLCVTECAGREVGPYLFELDRHCPALLQKAVSDGGG